MQPPAPVRSGNLNASQKVVETQEVKLFIHTCSLSEEGRIDLPLDMLAVNPFVMVVMVGFPTVETVRSEIVRGRSGSIRPIKQYLCLGA